MTPDEIRSIASDLESVVDWAKSAREEISVHLETDYYSVDLGQFGEREMNVVMEDDSYEIDVDKIFDAAPYDLNDLETMVSELENHANTLENGSAPTSLADVLSEMAESEDEDEQALANTLGLVYALYQRLKASGAAFTAPLPVGAGAPPVEGPQPWPGALRAEIDYTAEDFPLLYDPPPGFKWARSNSSFTYDDPTMAERIDASARAMMLDNLGRVSWSNKADADLSGVRWAVWNEVRGEIPCARGFNEDTPPRAIDEDGTIMPEDHTSGTVYCENAYNWYPGAEAEGFAGVAQRRGGTIPESVSTPETTNEFAPPAAVSV